MVCHFPHCPENKHCYPPSKNQYCQSRALNNPATVHAQSRVKPLGLSVSLTAKKLNYVHDLWLCLLSKNIWTVKTVFTVELHVCVPQADPRDSFLPFLVFHINMCTAHNSLPQGTYMYTYSSNTLVCEAFKPSPHMYYT